MSLDSRLSLGKQSSNIQKVKSDNQSRINLIDRMHLTTKTRLSHALNAFTHDAAALYKLDMKHRAKSILLGKWWVDGIGTKSRQASATNDAECTVIKSWPGQNGPSRATAIVSGLLSSSEARGSCTALTVR
eukprot:4701193-Pleurochrysis_carterae.AAC.1